MEKTKSRLTQKSVTNFLSNNAIVILILLMVLFVGFTQSNFWSWNNARNLIIAHVLATWFNAETDRAYTPEDVEELAIGQIDRAECLPSRDAVRLGDWEIAEGSDYAEWVRIIDGRVVSLGDSLGREPDPEIAEELAR